MNPEIDEFGNKRWWKDDKLHRDDGPAFEGADGYKEWYKNGELVFDLPAHYPLKILVEHGALSPIQIAKERLK